MQRYSYSMQGGAFLIHDNAIRLLSRFKNIGPNRIIYDVYDTM